jgi:hypothetical protein
MITEYSKPFDIYRKLLREARRTWLSKDHTEASDHLFNFCVTCVSLRDWVIKHLNMDRTQKDSYRKEWRSIGYFGACADIANSAKHFGLDYGKTSSVKNINANTEQMIAIGPGGVVLPSIKSEKPFFKIYIDSNEVDLLVLLYTSCKDWENQLKSRAITDEALPEIAGVFLESA